MARNTKSPVAVPAARVRAAFAAGEFTAPDAALPSLLGGSYTVKGGYVPGTGVIRGRLNPLAIEAFNEQVKGEVYGGEKSAAESSNKTVEVPMFSQKNGRPVKPKVLPIGEVRALAGIEGRKGRISQEALLRASVALGGGPKA